jgi:glyoxylase-like metal-dependent hydrolase (beta-lactamase superfamily II)
MLEEAGSVTLVDTGFPAHVSQLGPGLRRLGLGLSDVEAVVLTHAHPDHLGFADALRRKADVPVYLHEDGVERALAGGEPPIGGFLRNVWRPAVLRYLVEIYRSDGLSVPPLMEMETFEDGATLDVPGAPEVIHVPGHTEDEVSLFVPDRDTLFCGDALVTLDLSTGERGDPQLLPRWVNQDHDQARESLRRLDALGEVYLLPGHGDPWGGEMHDAVQSALRS